MSSAILDNLVGLRSAKRLIQRLAEGDTGVQSVLIYGPAGSGKTALGQVLIESWLSRTPGAENDSAINAFRRGNCVDCLEIRPVGLSNIIKVSALHKVTPNDPDYPTTISDFVRTTPLMARNKVVRITDCERMNASASNALLKTLEEPPPHVRMLLTTSEIGSVRQTIRSRCLCVACEAPTQNELRSVLLDATATELRMSGGAPGRLQFLRQIEVTVKAIERLAADLIVAKRSSALSFTDRVLAIASQFADSQKLQARVANAATIEMLGTYLAGEGTVNPLWLQEIAETHRRILGNGGAAIVLDAMFTRIIVD